MKDDVTPRALISDPARSLMRTLFLVTLLLALYGTAVCSEDASEYPEEPEDAYGGGETYGGGEGGEGGGGGVMLS